MPKAPYKHPTVFVGAPFAPASTFGALKKALDRVPLEFIFADSSIKTKQLLERVRTGITRADYSLFDITGWNPNVTLELGLAEGLNEDYYVLFKPGKGAKREPPADLRGLQRITYTTFAGMSADSLEYQLDDLLVRKLTHPRYIHDRWLAAGVVFVVLVVGAVAAVLASSGGEEGRVSDLFAAAKAYDNDKLAAFIVPSARTGDKTADAKRALSLAFAGSSIECLATLWGSAFTKTSGVTIDFTGVKVATISKSGNLAIVQAQGTLAPAAPTDPIVDREAKRVCQRDFDLFVSLARSASGDWYVIAQADGLPLPSHQASANPHAALITPTPPTAPPTPIPTPVPTPIPTPTPVRHLIPGTYPAPATATLTDVNSGWRVVLKEITINSDESLLFSFELTIGPADAAWAARDSQLLFSNGGALLVIGSKSTFYDGGKGPGAQVRVALAFPSGLAGGQPYVIRMCGNLGYCWPPFAGPLLGER